MLTSAGWAAARRVLLSSSGRVARLAPRTAMLPTVRMISISASMRAPAAKSKAKSTTSASKKTAAKKPAIKKAAAKPKAKATKAKAKAKRAVKKPAIKKAKKEVTPEQKEKKELREMKKMALKAPTRLPESAWSVYVASNLATGKGEFAEKVKLAASSFKNLPESEKERLHAVGQANQVANKEAHKAWIDSHPPEAIYMANLARRRLARKLEKSRVYLLHDDRLPRRAPTAYILFVKERLNQRADGTSLQDAFRACAEDWKSMSEAEKAPYNNRSVGDREKASAAMKALKKKGKEYWKAELASPKSKSSNDS